MADETNGLKVTHAGGLEPHKTLVTSRAPEPGAPASVGTLEQRRAPPSGPAAGQAAPPRTVPVPQENGGRLGALEKTNELLTTACEALRDGLQAAHERLDALERKVFGDANAPTATDPAPSGESGAGEAPAAKTGKR